MHSMSAHRGSLRLGVFLLAFFPPLVLTLCIPAVLPAQEQGEGPTSLFLAYECKPEKRAAFRTYLKDAGMAQFEKWKKAGTFKDYFIIFSSYVNRGAWDALIRLDFNWFVDTEKWKAIERTMPAGLSAEALALCSPEGTYMADLMWQRAGSARDPAKAVYLMTQMEWVERNRFLMYMKTKTKPELDALLDEGLLSWYGIYVNQNPSGRPWDALLLLEYKDITKLAQREVVEQRLRSQKFAGKDPAWSFAVAGTAGAIKEQRETIVADPLVAR